MTMELSVPPTEAQLMELGYLNEDGKIAAFVGLVEYDGPTQASYSMVKGDDVEHFQYQTFAWQSNDPAKIVARVKELAKQIKGRGDGAVVWRHRPKLIRYEGRYRFYSRLHTLPSNFRLLGAKAEGEETPEA